MKKGYLDKLKERLTVCPTCGNPCYKYKGGDINEGVAKGEKQKEGFNYPLVTGLLASALVVSIICIVLLL